MALALQPVFHQALAVILLPHDAAQGGELLRTVAQSSREGLSAFFKHAKFGGGRTQINGQDLHRAILPVSLAARLCARAFISSHRIADVGEKCNKKTFLRKAL